MTRSVHPPPAWARRPRDAFGRLVVEPAALPREDRLQMLRAAAQRLAESARADERYLGQALVEWLAGNVRSLEAALAVKAPRGSHATPARAVRQVADDALIVSFAARVGSARKAAAVLRGDADCPVGVDHPGVRPMSESAIRRARQRVAKSG